MTNDDWIYCFLLILSLLFGIFLREVKHGFNRQVASVLFGLLLVTCVCGSFIWHSLAVTVGFILLHNALPRKLLHVGSFIWSFGYLAFFRSAHWFGFVKVPPHANAVQLLITLKLIGVAFEIVDSYRVREKLRKMSSGDEDFTKLELQQKYENIQPNNFDIFTYSFCFVGLLTGPYYKYRTFHDMIHNKSLREVPLWKEIQPRLIHASCFAFVYFFASHYIYIDVIRHNCQGFAYNFFFMILMFMVFRFRMYFAWIMSECCCISSGLGAYPTETKPRCGQGPTQLQAFENVHTSSDSSEQYDFECIHNISIWGCEMTPTVREGMKSWNMTVQYWLAHFIYRRVPMKSVRTAVTMLVSAYWHGLHPGYYLSFLTMPLTLIAEDSLKSICQGSPFYSWLAWFYKMRVFDYTCMAFLLLDYDSTVAYWSCIYYAVHVMSVVLIGLDFVYRFTSRLVK